MRRRDLLGAAVAACAGSSPALRRARAAAVGAETRQRPFDYAWLKGHARELAHARHRPAPRPLSAALRGLDWDGYQAIRYRADRALWAGARARFQVQFFHLGLSYTRPVRMYEVTGGLAREVAYDPAMYDYGRSGITGAGLPQDPGFAGFRGFYRPDFRRDVFAFLGASYFRAVGAEMQYGLSARGLAIDCGMDRPEEFPEFTAFWLERPAPDADSLTVHALLDSESVAGAYRFRISPRGTMVMDVDVALYPRKPIERLGVAPLTSMYQHGENDRRMAGDWRPEIHDSDGLAMWTGNGEWIWRPLANPACRRVNAYQDENPRGFGLLQRDRSFDHYQDDGAYYDRRPNAWVEPRAGWGRGAVELVELPTPDETNDNIVAFWNPAVKPAPGQELLMAYRLHWGSTFPSGSPLAHVVATRTGSGGVVGRKREYTSWRFVVDFAGDVLSKLGRNAAVEPVITASSGTVEITSARPLDAVRGYRAMFDLRPAAGSSPVDLRLYLRTGNRPLSETWIYQWTPPDARCG